MPVTIQFDAKPTTPNASGWRTDFDNCPKFDAVGVKWFWVLVEVYKMQVGMIWKVEPAYLEQMNDTKQWGVKCGAVWTPLPVPKDSALKGWMPGPASIAFDGSSPISLPLYKEAEPPKTPLSVVGPPTPAQKKALDRAAYLMTTAMEFIEKNELGHYTIEYDDTTCDGQCLVDDLEFAVQALAEEGLVSEGCQ